MFDTYDLSIYNFNNPYGYRYNINHPKVNELFRRYRAWKGIHRPLTDAERHDFETYLDSYFKSNGLPPVTKNF